MFRQIASNLQNPADVFAEHPLVLAGALEDAWTHRFSPPTNPPAILARSLPLPLLNGARALANPPTATGQRAFLTLPPQQQFVVRHLIYAYMIENTKIIEIFRRVLHEYLHGERLDIPSPAGQQWVRTTEELFYKDPPSFFVFSLTSQIRPDIRASRRNAYYRMFGLDLNHGTEDGRPYPYEKGTTVNRDFVPTFEKYLFEVWRGIINVNTTSGPNPTDDAAIQDQVRNLFDMLTGRRRNGNLSREEFLFVSTMAWFHLTVEFNSPIVSDLKAEGSSPGERLRKIGERVGLAAHGKADDLFSLADPMSRILLSIESGTFNDISRVRDFYANPPAGATTNPLRDDIKTIITNWSTATGRNIKGEPVTASPSAVAPAVSPTAGVPATASPNGKGSPVTVSRT